MLSACRVCVRAKVPPIVRSVATVSKSKRRANVVNMGRAPVVFRVHKPPTKSPRVPSVATGSLSSVFPVFYVGDRVSSFGVVSARKVSRVSNNQCSKTGIAIVSVDSYVGVSKV